jgi:threonine 3-dehydrogenase
MKAIVKERPVEGREWKRGLSLVERPEPGVESTTDVKIRVAAGAICGTDGGIYDSKDSLRREMLKAERSPVIIGHEFCGKISDAGTKAKEIIAQSVIRYGRGLKPVAKFIGRRNAKQLSKDKNLIDILGEHFYASAEMHVTDGTCYQCRLGERHVCQNTVIKGVHDDGAFASHVVVPAGNIVLFAEGEVPPDIIAFMDALGNATHTVQSVPTKGDTIAILGCGVQGLMAAAVAKYAGAKKILVTDASHGRMSHEKLTGTRFRLARLYGADACFDVSVPEEHEAFIQRVKKETNGTGVDAVYEMSGSYRAYEDAFRVVRMGGAISLLGLPSGVMQMDFAKDVIFRGVTIHGIIGRRVFETWDLMREILKKGLAEKFLSSGFITHDLPLEKFEEGFAALRDGDGLKILLRPAH